MGVGRVGINDVLIPFAFIGWENRDDSAFIVGIDPKFLDSLSHFVS